VSNYLKRAVQRLRRRQNIGAEKLASNSPVEAEVLVCGDNSEAVEAVREILAHIGLNSWAAGPLINSAATEAMTSLLIQINRKHKVKQAGIRIFHEASHASALPALSVFSVLDLPLFETGQSVGLAICYALDEVKQTLVAGDAVVVAQKIVSKAEGCKIGLATIAPSTEAVKLAAITGKDARYIQLVLNESEEIMRSVPDTVIARHKSGHVVANAGLDMSNIEHADESPQALMWPKDASHSAEIIRQVLQAHFQVPLAVIISDSVGRAWRMGTTGTAIGVAGMKPLRDRRGEKDLYGRTLEATVTAVADEIAAAASLVIGEGDERTPVAIVRGAQFESFDGFGEKDLLRAKDQDLFR
jgi:coenzyme F420-0:L-glutamate ligase / coenzyme F420-1:gamma-L-glutamate ligase